MKYDNETCIQCITAMHRNKTQESENVMDIQINKENTLHT